MMPMMVQQPCLHFLVDTLEVQYSRLGWLAHHHSLLSLELGKRITNSTTLLEQALCP